MAKNYSAEYKPLKCWARRVSKLNERGYVVVHVPEHPCSYGIGWVYEHRLVMERKMGRLLRPYETVHHINERKQDNRELNLFVCNRDEHNKAHALTLALN